MFILISCAKIMRECNLFSTLLEDYSKDFSSPCFAENAALLAEHISKYDVESLADNLKVNRDIAQQNFMRYRGFGSGENSLLPSLFSYHGIVFKNIAPEEFSYDDMMYANEHLMMTSFLYGLLRPLDLIEHYRLEGKFKLNLGEYKNVFAYWKPRLTDFLIERVKQQGGVLMNLASGEMRDLFDWKRVCREVEVISPEFFVNKAGQTKSIVVYTKIARGLMTKFIIKNRITDATSLLDFSDNGYTFIGDKNDKIYKFITDFKA